MTLKKIIKSYFSKPLTRELLVEMVSETMKEERLCEGRGMVARSPGDVFTNDAGEEMEFAGHLIFPPEGPGYDSVEELLAAIKKRLGIPEEADLKDGVKGKGIILNKVIRKLTSGTRAAILVGLNGPEGTVGFLKFFNSMSQKGFGRWTETSFFKDTGFRRAKSTATLERVPLQPTILISDYEARGVGDLYHHVLGKVNELVKKGELPKTVSQHITQLFQAASSGGNESPVLEGALPLKTSYEKYLGEILQPVALITGWLTRGDREASEKNLVKKINPRLSYNKMLARYPQSVTNALVDSEIVAGEVVVGISSKAGAGASASLKGLYDTLKANPDLKINNQLATLIDDIMEKSSTEGPIAVATQWKLISPADAKHVLSLFRGNISEVDLPTYLKMVKARKISAPSKRLVEISKLLGGFSPLNVPKVPANYKPAYHYLAAIAKNLAVSFSKGHDVERDIRLILQKSSMVQIHTKTKKVGENGLQFVEFYVKYPPVFNGKIKLDASKNYFATSPAKGRLGFKIK